MEDLAAPVLDVPAIKSTQALGVDAGHFLALQGFCTINLDLEEERLNDAQGEVSKLEEDGKMDVTPVLLYDGFLGEEGSTKVCELSLPFDFNDGVSLEGMNSRMDELITALRPYLDSQDLGGAMRTNMIVHRGSLDMAMPKELTADECARYQSIFSRQCLMILIFLGPGDGILELEPFDGTSGVQEIVTKPGMMMVLRADALAHVHSPHDDDSTVLSCFLCSPQRSVHWSAESKKKAPVCKYLDEFATKLMMKQKMEGRESEIPRDWRLSANHEVWKNQRAAVTGYGMRVCGAHDKNNFFNPLVAGVDFAVEVPLSRWDHSEVYEDGPDTWLKSGTSFAGPQALGKIVTNVRHGAFMDGVDLFDPKTFTIQPAEALGMCPEQRFTMETCWESLHMTGYAKKELMNAYIGVFQAGTKLDWGYMPDNPIAATGNGGDTILAARQSFSLGMQGPCLTLDQEMCSSHNGVALAAQAVVPVNKEWSASGNDTPASVAGGAMVMCCPFYWPRYGLWMNPNGRCLTFDTSASGWVRGDCVGSICVRGWNQYIDGQTVETSKPASSGAIVAWKMNTNGRGASMTAPSAAQEQEVVRMALKMAGLTAFDVDSVETHGDSSLLNDAIEVTSLGLSLRSEADGNQDEVLTVGCVKTNHCTSMEACGMSAFIKVFFSQRRNVMAPNIHLRALNPHVELDSAPLVANLEAMSYRMQQSYHGTTARSFSGMNAHCICWGKKDQVNVTQTEDSERPAFCFWPGGGGQMPPELKASFGYMIVGSWLSWEQAEPMQTETDGASFIVTLGENRLETFQIWIDGDPERALGPGAMRAESGSAVAGPMPMDQCDFWSIDGRSAAIRSENLFQAKTTPMRDEGRPGDKFKVVLKFAGKYCGVTWSKIYEVTDETELTSQSRGTYYFSGSVNNWEVMEMTSSSDTPGVYTLEVGPVPPRGAEFYILRNMDTSQTFHPSHWNSDLVVGPDSEISLTWPLTVDLTGKNVFRIKFSRIITFNGDEKSIEIEAIRKEYWSPLRM